MPVWPTSCRFIRTKIQYSNLVELVRITKKLIHKYGKNKSISGYQETLDQKFYLIKRNYFSNNAIKRQMQQSKDRCNKWKEKYLISKQLEHRCIKMRMSIYTKQIGNYLNNLVLAKQVPQIMKTLWKEIAKRVTVLTKSEVSQISKTRQRMPY